MSFSSYSLTYMVDKYKSTKCIDHLFGHAGRRKTNRLIQRKLKLDRRKSASTVKAEIEKFHCTLIQFENGHMKLDQLLVRSLP